MVAAPAGTPGLFGPDWGMNAATVDGDVRTTSYLYVRRTETNEIGQFQSLGQGA